MKATIRVDVKDESMAAAIERALQDEEVVTFLVCVGTLKPFSVRARRRILTFVNDALSDPRERKEENG